MGVGAGSIGFVSLRMFQAFARGNEIETADGEAEQKQGTQADGLLQNGMPGGFPPTAALELKNHGSRHTCFFRPPVQQYAEATLLLS